MTNVVQCEDLEQLAEMVALLQKQGMAFSADAIDFTIRITGY